MKFLTGPEILEQVKALVRRDGELKIAVAYWGKGAAELIRIKPKERRARANTRIICDLLSGFCHPNEIRELQNICGRKNLRMLDRLHAKVWISGDHVVIGSANASKQALCTGGDSDARHNKEAALSFCHAELSEDVRIWFENLWDESAEPSDRDFEVASQKWNKHQEYSGNAFAHSNSDVGEKGVELSEEERTKLRQEMIRYAVGTAVSFCQDSRKIEEDLILQVWEECWKNQVWRGYHTKYVQSGIDNQTKSATHQINPSIGKSIREGVRGEVIKLRPGVVQRLAVRNPELPIGRYTVLKRSDWKQPPV